MHGNLVPSAGVSGVNFHSWVGWGGWGLGGGWGHKWTESGCRVCLNMSTSELTPVLTFDYRE